MVAEADHPMLYSSRSMMSAGDQASTATQKTPIVPATSSIYVFSRSRYEGRLKELHQEEKFLARKLGAEPLKDQVEMLEAELRRVQSEKGRLERELISAKERCNIAEESIQRLTKEKDNVRDEMVGDLDCLKSELSGLKQNHDTTLLELEEREAQILQLRDTLRLCREQASGELENRQQFADKLKEQYERALESKEYELRKLHAEKMRECDQKAQLARELSDAKSALQSGNSVLNKVTTEKDNLCADLDKRNGILQSQLLDLRSEYEQLTLQVNEKDLEISRLRRTIRELEEHASAELEEGVAMTMEVKSHCLNEIERKRMELNEVHAEKSRIVKQRVQLECELGETKRTLIKTTSQLQQALRDRDNLDETLKNLKRTMQAELDELRNQCKRAGTELHAKESEVDRLTTELSVLNEQHEASVAKSSELHSSSQEYQKLLETKEALLEDTLQTVQRLTKEREDRAQALAKMKEEHEKVLREKEAQLQMARREIASVSEIKDLRERSVQTKDQAVKMLESDLTERTKELEQAILATAELKRAHGKEIDSKNADLERSVMSEREARQDLEKSLREVAHVKDASERELSAKDLYIQDLRRSLEACNAKLEASTIASVELRDELERTKHCQEAELHGARFQLEKCSSDLHVSNLTMSEMKKEHSVCLQAKDAEIRQLIEAARIKDAAIATLKEAAATKEGELVTLSTKLATKEGGIGAVESNLLKLTVSVEKLCQERECKHMIEHAGGVGALAEIIECHPVESEVSKHARRAMAQLMAE
jgi:hypothetical protein